MTKLEFHAQVEALTRKAASRVEDARRLQSQIADAGVRDYLDGAVRDLNDVAIPARMVADPDPPPAIMRLALEMATLHFENGSHKIALIENYTKQAGFDITLIG